jgi:hypothetical protein
MPGYHFRMLMRVEIRPQVRGDVTATLRSPLPDEVEFESLATRVRAFTWPKDRLYWPKALGALDRLTGLDDMPIRVSSPTRRLMLSMESTAQTAPSPLGCARSGDEDIGDKSPTMHAGAMLDPPTVAQ